MITLGLKLFNKKMGGGKTLLATICAFTYLWLNPESKVYANYKINHPRAVYCPYGFLPFDEIRDCMVIFDDMEDLSWLGGLMSIVANYSRKRNITIICTGQYYAQFSRKARLLMDYEVEPTGYSKKSDNIFYNILKKDADDNVIVGSYGHYFTHASKYFDKYDTTEEVNRPYPHIIKREILKMSNSPDELDDNLFLWTGNARNRYKKLRNEFYAIKGWDVKGKGYQSLNLTEEQLIAIWFNKIKNVSQIKIAAAMGKTQPQISEYITAAGISIEDYVLEHYPILI